MSRLRNENGSASTEMAILMGGVFISFLLLSVYAGLVSRQQADVRGAAHAAARAGSLQAWPNATPAVQEVAAANLATGGRVCDGGPTVVVNSGQAEFEQKIVDGMPQGFISVSVACTTQLMPVFGWQNTTEYTAVEIVDTFREESP